MRSDKNKAKLMIAEFFTSDIDHNGDVEIKRKAILLNIICIIGIINLVPLGITALICDKTALGIFELVAADVLIIILILLRKKGYNDLFNYIGVSFVGALFIYLVATGGFNNTGHLWCYTFPLFTLFLLGSKKGAIATFILLVFVNFTFQ